MPRPESRLGDACCRGGEYGDMMQPLKLRSMSGTTMMCSWIALLEAERLWTPSTHLPRQPEQSEILLAMYYSPALKRSFQSLLKVAWYTRIRT